MHIAVCIKQVPDAPSIKIDQKRMTVIREGVESIVNPADHAALAAALDLRESFGGRVTALTMGPPQSEEALREALAAGADDAVLLSDPAFAGADTLATSHVLAVAVRRLDPFPDLILCGKQTIDSDTGHVGPQIAEELGLPQVCCVREIHPEEGALVVRREAEGFLYTIRVSLPALLTVSRDLRTAGHIRFGEIEKAFTDRKVQRWDLAELGLDNDEVGFPGSATQVWKIYKPPPKRKGTVITEPARELVARLISELESLSILDEEEHE